MSQKDIRFDAVLPSHLIFNENDKQRKGNGNQNQTNI